MEKSALNGSLVFYRAEAIKVIYIPCFKNASTSLLLWLAEVEASTMGISFSTSSARRRHSEKHLRIDSVNISEVAKYLAAHSDYFLFGVSRNPYSRVASAYRDKVNRLTKIAKPSLYYEAKLRQIFGGPTHWRNNKEMVAYLRRKISFSTYLSWLQELGLDNDVHFQLQASLMRPDLLKSARFYRQENFTSFLSKDIKNHLRQHLFINNLGYIPEIPQKNLSLAAPEDHYKNLYLAGLQNVVAGLYMIDFLEFGYNPEIL